MIPTAKISIEDKDDRKRKMERIKHGQQEGRGRIFTFGNLHHLTVLLGTIHAFEKDNGRLTLTYYCGWQNSAFPHKNNHILVPGNCEYIRLRDREELRLQM